jgi:molecular chaperone HscA
MNIGIDLGTTNSLVAVVMDGSPRCLLDDDGEALLPSAVRIDGDRTVVGSAAFETTGGELFTSVKRFMGRTPREVRDEAELFHYDLVDDPKVVRFRAGDKVVTPIEISARILAALKERAVECLFATPQGAVITVPAYFDDAQRQATKDAARVAGLEVLRLLNEPTAAALAYGLQESVTGARVAIYDLGGGTFDVSILELRDGVFQVMATSGDTRLGGDDFDQALAAVLLRQAGIQDPDGPTFRAAVRAAESAKRQLTDAAEVTFAVELQGKPIEARIDRSSFERLIRPFVERTMDACRFALADAGIAPAEIDHVVLVGGSTRVPFVRRMVEELFGKAPHGDIDPDQVVAVGAAIQADILSGSSELKEDVLLLDVIPLSLGIEVMGGVVERIIPRTSSIPATASQTFTTHIDDQSAVDIHVVQGERELVRDNRSLARFKLGIPPLPAGLPRVKVTFLVDADGLLHVSAVEEHTGSQASIDVEPSYGLGEEEIESMLEAAIDHAETDIDERLRIEAVVEAEQILAALDKALGADAAMLAPGEGERLAAASSALRAAMGERDRARIQALSKELDELSAPFAQRRIERDLNQALKGQRADAISERLDRR